MGLREKGEKSEEKGVNSNSNTKSRVPRRGSWGTGQKGENGVCDSDTSLSFNILGKLGLLRKV